MYYILVLHFDTSAVPLLTVYILGQQDFSCSSALVSGRPKQLFWFRSNTKTQIGRYFHGNTVTDTETTFQKENLVIDCMGLFFYPKRAFKTKFAAKF